MDKKNILDFIAEAGMLKRVQRSGWWMLGTPYRESVAEHSYRCAVIAYILARMEGVEVREVLLMSLFGDLPEARINDQHKVANRYLNSREAEKKAYEEQIDKMPGIIREELSGLRAKYDAQKTKESIIARDADILECLIQAKEYLDLGFGGAEKFFKKGPGHLCTDSAKELWDTVAEWDSGTWWEALGKFDR